MWLKITLSRLSTRGRTAACSLPHLPLITEEKFNVNRRGGWARQLRRHWFSGATNGPIRMRDGLLLDSHWPVDSSRRGQSCFQPFFFSCAAHTYPPPQVSKLSDCFVFQDDGKSFLASRNVSSWHTRRRNSKYEHSSEQQPTRSKSDVIWYCSYNVTIDKEPKPLLRIRTGAAPYTYPHMYWMSQVLFSKGPILYHIHCEKVIFGGHVVTKRILT